MGETNTWEQRRLGDLITEVKAVDSESNAPVMMISASEGFIEQLDRYAYDNAGESLKKYIILQKGELAYNHGASKLRPYGSCFSLLCEKARVPFVYHCFSIKKGDSIFYSTVLNGYYVESQLRRIVSSGARMDGLLNISFEDYTKINISIPDVLEQKDISKLIVQLDKLITLHQ